MRTLLCFLFLSGLVQAMSLGEETGRQVHLQPDSEAPVIGVLPADSFLLPPPEPVELTAEQTEAGWQAISFLNDFSGHVRQAEIRKDFTITIGAPIHLEPSDDAAILTRAEADDHFEVEHLNGDWAEVSFRKPLTGYIQKNGAAPAEPSEAVEEETVLEPASDQELFTAEGEPEAEMPAVATEDVVSERGAVPTDGMLRTFQGWLTETRSFFGFGQPFDYQIVDQSGNRIAYVDLSRLLITDPIGQLLGYRYEVYGRAEPVEGRRDFVIRVERMLRK